MSLIHVGKVSKKIADDALWSFLKKKLIIDLELWGLSYKLFIFGSGGCWEKFANDCGI